MNPLLVQHQQNTNHKPNHLLNLKTIVPLITLWILINNLDKLLLKVKNLKYGNKLHKVIEKNQKLLLILIQNSLCNRIVHLKYYLLGLYLNSMIMIVSTISSPILEELLKLSLSRKRTVLWLNSKPSSMQFKQKMRSTMPSPTSKFSIHIINP